LVDHHLNLKIWSFSGSLAHLCRSENIIVVETYPAEFYNHLSLSLLSPTEKASADVWIACFFAVQLIIWAETYNLDLDDSIKNSVMDGFGDMPDGEDRLDAFIGLYGMINVVLGYHNFWEPNIHYISKIEGLIFGQEQP
jgi:hypothetical protein